MSTISPDTSKRVYTALPLEGLTHQEQAQAIFDRVITHLKAQGHPAQEEDGSCAYRAEDGSACAVGCLIPDEDYNICFESKSVEALKSDIRRWDEESLQDVVIASPGEMLERLHLMPHTAMLLALQIDHDAWDSYEPFALVAPKFAVVAKRYALNTNVLET